MVIKKPANSQTKLDRTSLKNGMTGLHFGPSLIRALGPSESVVVCCTRRIRFVWIRNCATLAASYRCSP